MFVFYPFAFSPVCTDQLSVYGRCSRSSRTRGRRCTACRVTRRGHSRRSPQLGIDIEQLSDFEPKGDTCRAFGVLHPGGFPQRALVMIGHDAVVGGATGGIPSDLPGANLIFDAL